MKCKIKISSGPRPSRSGTVFSTLLLAGALLLGGRERGAAQPFPSLPGHDITNSMGVFQIVVDPAFYPLMNPSGALAAFPGFSSGVLTSPLCIDPATTIGLSGAQARPYSFGAGIPLDSPTFDTISGYGAYPLIPALWASAPSHTEEVLTEIENFTLSSVGSSTGLQCPPDPRIPSVQMSWPMVTAGTGANVFPRSIGMVQENTPTGTLVNNFPARSFFDIFVNVSLPGVPGTVSYAAFPPLTGAVLYNDSPLLVTNTSLYSLPPQVIYIHGETAAVPVKFQSNNPPYWSAGDIFGYLVLAGHGTITADCTDTSAVELLLDATLGPAGSPVPGMPVEWLRTSNLLPSSGTYNSVTGSNFGGQTIDSITYMSAAGGSIYARNISIGPFPFPIQPPPYFGTNYYQPTNTILATFEMSSDGSSWSPAQLSGPLSVVISNVSPNGSSVSTYATELLQLNLSGTDPQFGSVMVRLDPLSASTGQTTIRPDPRGYRISSFFDVFTDLSIDGGGTWLPANRSIRVQASAPPAAPNSIFPALTGNNLVLSWLGSFNLQAATSVKGPFLGVTGVTTSNGINYAYSTRIGGGQMYFRLAQ